MKHLLLVDFESVQRLDMSILDESYRTIIFVWAHLEQKVLSAGLWQRRQAARLLRHSLPHRGGRQQLLRDATDYFWNLSGLSAKVSRVNGSCYIHKNLEGVARISKITLLE
jgi:hypothetical protein